MKIELILLLFLFNSILFCHSQILELGEPGGDEKGEEKVGKGKGAFLVYKFIYIGNYKIVNYRIN